LLHWKNSFRWFRFLLLRGTAESGALKANALPGGAKRLAVRAVKAAWFLRSSKRSGRPLTEEAGGPGVGFQQEGLNERVAFNRFGPCSQLELIKEVRMWVETGVDLDFELQRNAPWTGQ